MPPVQSSLYWETALLFNNGKIGHEYFLFYKRILAYLNYNNPHQKLLCNRFAFVS